MAAAPDDLCTVEDVQAMLAMDAGLDVALLQSLITGASALAVTYIGQRIKSASYNEVRNGKGGNALTLRQGPITAVASLKIDGRTVSPAAYGQVGYTFDEDFIYLRGMCFTRDVQNVEITYTAGYNPVPDDLKQAVIDMVAVKYKRRLDLHVSGKTLEGQVISYTMADMPAATRLVFNQYQRAMIMP